ncbi:MAG: hypothetical protein WCR55_14895 [Lentisphaerota bacterium]
MTKINASFYKDTSTNTEICSATIEDELPDGSSHEQIKENLDRVLDILRNSVEAQVNRKVIDCKPILECKPFPLLPAVSDNKFYADKPKRAFVKEQTPSPATESQITFMTNLASKQNLSFDDCLKNHGLNQKSQLNTKNCHDIIKKLKESSGA